jgi:MFS family permease
VWGAASVVGPAVGGLLSEYLSWRWIFYLNLPIGLLAVWMLRRHLVERIERQPHQLDYPGAATLTAGCALVILGLLQGGVAWPWTSAPGVGVPAAGVMLLIAFVLVEQRRPEPVLPLWVFRRRVLVGGNLVAVVIGAVLIGLSSYVPAYAQGVLGAGPIAAGFAVAALSIGWPLAATLSGRVYLRIGFRDTALLGSVGVVAGAAACVALTDTSPLAAVATACCLVGLGLGFCSSPTIVAVQSAVGWKRRGVVTGTNMFARSIGSAVGVAVFGAIANATIAHRLADPPPGLPGRLPTADAAGDAVLDHSSTIAPATLAFLRSALFDATHHVFVGLLVVAVLGVGAVLLVPRRTEPLTFSDDLV